ncbi:hypothetical protein [Emcibacter sp. SYSU 3D8]|uniref:hypothetical protein n=1 Tax=Emcibacter sp. SYSU 3D8 TaxID=3133969 RepID=UPI0031FF3B5B
MTDRLTALERVFELARSGSCDGIDALRKQLKAEGYADTQITGPTLLKQLRELCAAAQKP